MSQLPKDSKADIIRIMMGLEAVRTYLTTDFEDPCDSCRLLEKCLSGCLAQKAIAYNSLDKKPDPDCLGPNFQGDSA